MTRLAAHVLLEREWAEFNGLHPDNVVVCSSGTAALHLALEALGLDHGASPYLGGHGLGHEVIVPDYTMVACPRAVSLAGMVPVFVDCDNRLLLDLDPAMCKEAKCTASVAVMPVHVYGRRVNVGDVLDMAEARGLAVVEDLAEAHGVRPHPDSDAACWSFYKNKIVAGEEGGAVWFRNRNHARKARQLRTLGFTEAHDYRHVPRGHNYRLADCLAELVLRSIKDYPHNYRARREAETEYDALCPSGWRMPPRDAPWVYDLCVKGMTDGRRYEVVSGLNRMGVAARHGFVRMSEQEEYRKCRVVRGTRPDVTGEVIYLPLTLRLDRAGYAAIFDYIRKVVGA